MCFVFGWYGGWVGRTLAFFEKGQYDLEKMIMGPFLRIEFISTSISCSESVSSLLSLCFFLAALLSRDLEAPVLPTRATPSSSAFGLTTFLPPLLLFPSDGIILRPATGLLSAAGAS